MKFKGGIFKLEFLRTKYEKQVNDAVTEGFKNAVAAFVTETAMHIPFYTGESRGSLVLAKGSKGRLNTFLNVRRNLLQPTLGGQRVGITQRFAENRLTEGSNMGQYTVKLGVRGGGKFTWSFTWSSSVPHYRVWEKSSSVGELPPGMFSNFLANPIPWESVLAGRAGFRAVLSKEIVSKLIGSPKKFIRLRHGR